MAEDDLHVVLGEKHGDAIGLRQSTRERDQCDALLRRHAGRGLVHQQEARAIGERDGELHALQVAIGEERAWPRRLLEHAHALEQAIRLCGVELRESRERCIQPPLARHERHLHVLAHAHRAECGGDLEGAPHAPAPDIARRKPDEAPPIQRDVAGVGRELTVEQVEAGRLARSVWPDHGDELARGDAERHAAQRLHAAIALGEPLDHERRHRAKRSLK